MRFLLGFACLLTIFISTPLAATWSIAVADTETQEVAVAGATCLTGFDLRAELPAVRVGLGAGAAQSQIDSQGTRRNVMVNGLNAGQSSDAIMQQLANLSGSAIHQNGLADANGDSATFSGSSTGAHSSGVTGQIGTLHYAIQGNVLTGRPVVLMAESAFRNTVGDVPARLMAAMEAARAMGGDGRCSCSASQPTACGAPPASFTKSADIGFFIVARVGDGDDPNCSSNGCADGDYLYDLNVAFAQRSDPDPVLQLRQQFDTFRQNLVGRPDAIQSTVAIVPQGDDFVLTVTPEDWQGTALASGINSVTVVHAAGSALATSIGAVTALGDGRFQATLTTTGSGLDRFVVTLRDGVRDVVIPPRRTTLQVQGGGPPTGDGLADDFEGDVSGWTTTGLWHLVTNSSCSPGFNSAARAFYFGQDADCEYSTGGAVTGTLVSPPITGVGAGSTLTFAYRRQVESFSGDFDRSAVDVSSDNGVTWNQVFSLNSSNASQNAWVSSPTIDLSGFAGANVRVRFRFDSVDGQFNNFLGWMIDDVLVTAADDTGGGGSEVFAADFDSDTDGFAYQDAAFGSTQPAYADGDRPAAAGFSGGALRVTVGGVDNADVLNMSGGFNRSFTLSQATALTLSLRYNVTQAPDYESDEFTDALLALDGNRIGTGGNDFLARVTGNGNGGASPTSGWVQVSVDLGVVAAGSHTLTLGGANNKKTFNNESSTIRFDDVVLRAP